ncbi:unnamed protein product [Protopolystoma xenopodis]|uniref:Uncharacterized protein n=1 Tax=Protopolystoma xenopodis TaxID=117903 RepID=A0A3S5A9B5_9PLAT|nr:unnamed protein product [Protopolystoma xenopodis]
MPDIFKHYNQSLDALLNEAAVYVLLRPFENLPCPLSDVGNHDNYYRRQLRIRCVLLNCLDNKTKL